MLSRRSLLSFAAATLMSLTAAPGLQAAQSFNVCWSHYTGWEPWAYAQSSGILKKWADKYKIDIKLTLVNDYVESINLYTAGKYDACTMTNMDVLTIPSSSGIDNTALIIGDFSNGNDGIVAKGIKTIDQLKGKKIKLVELSVSHYLLARALGENKMAEKDVKVVNTSDADIGGLFTADKEGLAVTWNPILMQLRKGKDTNLLFDSSKIPGEIIDIMVVKTAAPDTLKKALTGAWYETMAAMEAGSKTHDAALAAMAKTAGGSVEDFKEQLTTTKMFYKPADAVSFVKSPDLKKTMDYVRGFSFDHGLFGKGAKNKDAVGISFADGSTLGNAKNLKLRFDPTYMQMAADGKL